MDTSSSSSSSTIFLFRFFLLFPSSSLNIWFFSSLDFSFSLSLDFSFSLLLDFDIILLLDFGFSLSFFFVEAGVDFPFGVEVDCILSSINWEFDAVDVESSSLSVITTIYFIIFF